MLKQRIAMAVFLIPIVLCLIYLTNQYFFALAAAALIGVCAWEWAKLIGFKQKWQQILYAALLIGCLALLYRSIHLVSDIALVIYGLIIIWWGWVLYRLIAYQYNPKRKFFKRFGLSIVGMVLLLPMGIGLFTLKNYQELNGGHVLMFLLLLVWGSDSFAYFMGRKWGKHKLALKISPGKTWEGVYGALCAGVILALLGPFLMPNIQLNWIIYLALAIITVIATILGDLFESMVKREQGVKDSGHLLPGYGGVLDRLDSLTAAAPIFALGIFLITK